METHLQTEFYTERKFLKSFDLADTENKVNIVDIEIIEYSNDGEEYFYNINYIFDKCPRFIPEKYTISGPIYKNPLTENLVEFLLMDYDLLEYYVPKNKSPEYYKRQIINSLCAFSN